MSSDDIQQRVKETIYDHYPLNRLLPQSSVFNIFFQNYNKEDDKKCFLDNHKYLKLREGYFALFACKAFDEVKNNEHLLIFTDEEKGDVAFCGRRQDGKLDYFQYDIKEYHHRDPQNFESFLDQILKKPKILRNQYGLIIGVHRSVAMGVADSNKLDELKNKLSRGVFLVSDMSDDVACVYKSRVVYLSDRGMFDKEIETSNNGINDILIYQNVLNFVSDT